MTKNGTGCREAIIKKSSCINGLQSVKVTAFIRQSGVCKRYNINRDVHCKTTQKSSCKCSAVGSSSYRTYDGQAIHFYGDCRYTLSKYEDRRGVCSFDIEIQNDRRRDNRPFSYRRTVIIRMFGDVYELGPNRLLKVNLVKQSLPYEKGVHVKIFRSYKMLQFVAPRCSVRVAFNGRTNTFVEVSNFYARTMIGICGNCNGVQDDYRTRSGKEVALRKNKFALIANSYRVIIPGQTCKPAQHVTYKHLCGSNFLAKIKSANICHKLLREDNPFSKCNRLGHIDLRNYYNDCLMDICINQNKPKESRRSICKMLAGLSEVCAESGYSGIKWRSEFGCHVKCGANQHFTIKARPCPRTCENHFFGSKRPCYDLPEREGCACNRGFIRDGALCVRPEHCKCINLCVDRKSSVNCGKWKARGDCERFSEQMNVLCPKTCGFCKSIDRSCENKISTKKCLRFRRKGLCLQEFYRSICGLTCNFDRCKCGTDYSITDKCNHQTKIKTTTRYQFVRDSKGRCAKIVNEIHEPCDCYRTFFNAGPCNYCSGKRNITQSSEEIVGKKCVKKELTRFEDCQKCPENPQSRTVCIGGRLLQTTVTFMRLIGCFQCAPDQRVATVDIKCHNTRTEQIDPKNKCVKLITITERNPVNCKCESKIITQRIKICCVQFKKVSVVCVNKKLVYRTRFYRLLNGVCVPYYTTNVKNIVCQFPKPLIKGQCERFKDGKFFCQATDVSEKVCVNKNCQCKVRTIKRSRTCCCKNTEKLTICDKQRGILTHIRISYTLVGTGYNARCLKNERRSTQMIIIYNSSVIKRGKCQKNCLRRDTIIRTYRDGCSIKRVAIPRPPRKCCCTPRQVIQTTCVFNFRETTVFRRIVRNNKCVNSLVSRNKVQVTCPPSSKIFGNCTKNYQSMVTVSYHRNNCNCVRIERKETKRCNCREKIFGIRAISCNKRTGLGKKITYFRDTKCNNGQKICPYECVCLPPKTRSRCNFRNGKILHITKSFHIDIALGKCVSKKVILVRTPVCNKLKTIQHGCGKERPNYKKVIITKQILSQQTCHCKTLTITLWRLCRCPPPMITRKCLGDSIQTTTVTHQLHRKISKCFSTVAVTKQIIKCPQLTKSEGVVRISLCKYKKYKIYYTIENCACKFTRVSQIYYKCCRNTTKKVECIGGNSRVTIQTLFKLNPDHKKCLIYINRKSEAINCKSYIKVRRTKCKKGIYYIVRKYFHVTNCKCKRARIERIKVLCCNKKPQVKTVCIGKAWRTTTTVYSANNNDKCVRSESFKDHLIKCGSPYSIVCPCDPDTKLRRLRRFYYTVENCKCVRQKLESCFPCTSNKRAFDIRRNGICKTNGKTIVQVFEYFSRNEKCMWGLTMTYEDICKCPRDSSIRTCFGHSIIRTTTFRFVLQAINSKYPSHRCVRSEIVTDKLVACPTNYNYQQPCRNNELISVQCTYQRKNCRCDLSCKVIEKRPCDCKNKDKYNFQCRNNVKYFISHKYKEGRHQCMESVSETAIPERCTRLRKRRCGIPNIYKNNGIYRKCTIFFFRYNYCRCEKFSKRRLRLWKCIKPYFRERCAQNRKIRSIISFNRHRNKCIQNVRDEFIHYNCPRHRITSREWYAYTEYKLVYFVKENCVCRERIVFRRIWKCNIGQFQRRISEECRGNLMAYIQTYYVRVFIRRRLFPEVSSSMLEQSCQRVQNIKFISTNCYMQSFVIEICNVAQNRLKRITHTFTLENCLCKRNVIINHSPSCRACHKPKVTLTSCLPTHKNAIGYQYKTTTKWHITRKNTCESKTSKSLEVCRCPETQYTKECSNGQIILKTLQYKLHNNCKQTVSHRLVKSVFCYNNGKKNNWVVTKVDRCHFPGQYTVQHMERFVYNSRSCECHKQRKSVNIGICCKPCRYSRKCRKNRIVVRRICQYEKNLKCVKRTKRVISEPNCPRPTTEVVGHCNGRTITNRLTTYKNVNCQCIRKEQFFIQRKIPNTVKCVNNLWQVTIFDYQLINRRCFPKYPRMSFNRVFCNQNLRIFDQRVNECSFVRSYYRKKVVKCRCVDSLVRKETLYYKCCQRPETKTHCFKHRILVSTSIYYNLLQFRCFWQKSEIRRPVICRDNRLVDRVDINSYSYKLIYYRRVFRNCRCLRKFRYVVIAYLSCPHLKPYTRHYCEQSTGQQVTVHYSFVHSGIRCLKMKRQSTINTSCNIPCHQVQSSCVKHTQTIQIFCYRRKGCSCVREKARQHTVCCGRLKHITWTKVGKCNRHRKNYRRIRQYVLKLNPRTNRCQRKAIREQYDICCTRKSYSVQSCLNNIYHKVTHYSVFKNLLKNQCEKRISERISLISGCHRETTNKVSLTRFGKSGWCKAVYLITYPRNCHCYKIKKVEREICDCEAAFRPHTRVICKNNYLIVTERYTPRCSLKSVQWFRSSSVQPILNCNRYTQELGECFNSVYGFATKIRYLTTVRYSVENCSCVRHIVKTEIRHCNCRPYHTEEKCLGTKKVTTMYSYNVINGLCQQRKQYMEKEIPCPKAPKVLKSKCKNNKFIVSTTTFFNNNCKCQSTVTQRECDCKCPAESKRIRCSGNYFAYEIRTKYVKRFCRCIKTQSIMAFNPDCPSFVRKTVGKCIRRGRNSYRKVTRRSLIKNPATCTCQIKERVRRRICGCGKPSQQHTKCDHNRRVFETWHWIINRKKNRCFPAIKSLKVEPVNCPQSTVTKFCNYKTEIGTQINIFYYIENCRCIKKKRITRFACPCPPTPKLVKKGQCNIMTRRRTDTYRQMIAGHNKCESKKFHKTEICLCPKDRSYKICKNSYFLHLNVSEYLRNGRCHKRKSKLHVGVQCSFKGLVKIGKCRSNGFKTINYFQEFVRDCKCHLWKTRVENCRCRCRKDRKKERCDVANKMHILTLIRYSLFDCKCFKKVSTIKRQKLCKPPSYVVFRNIKNKANQCVDRTVTTSYHLSPSCHCVSKVKVTEIPCSCPPFENVFLSCDGRKHLEVIVKRKQRPLYNKCHQIISVIKKPIICNKKWKLIESSGCQPHGSFGIRTLIFKKAINTKCSCREITKSRNCNCICSGPPSLKQCDGKIIHHYSFGYKFVKCKCHRSIRKERIEVIQCRRRAPTIGRCRIEGNQCVRYVEHLYSYVQNCQCYYKKRVVRTGCDTCICQSSVSRTCNRRTNSIIYLKSDCKVLPSGFIRRFIHVNMVKVHCPNFYHCKSISTCNPQTLIETVKCTIQFLRRCTCFSHKKIEQQPCVCSPDKKSVGPCDSKTGTRRVTLTKYHLIKLNTGKKFCKKQKEHVTQEICGCLPDPQDQVNCVNNRNIRTSERCIFDPVKKTRHIIRTSFDETPSCSPAFQKQIGSCNKETGLYPIIIQTKTLVGCKCQSNQNVQYSKCCNFNDKTESICVSNKWVTLNHRFTLVNGECIKTTTRNEVIVDCPETKQVVINPSCGSRIRRTTSYRLVDCKCVQSVFDTMTSSSCPANTNTVKCIPEKGIYQTLVTSYSLNPDCSCSSITKRDDKQITCIARPLKIVSKSAHSNKDGVYDVITTQFEKRVGCECQRQTSKTYELSSCKASSTSTICRSNKLIKTEIYYESVKNDVGPYSHTCIKKEKTSEEPDIKCPEESKSVLSCENGVKTTLVKTYSLENCACKESTKTLIAKGCEKKYCYEMPNDSKCGSLKVPGDCDDDMKSMCPMTCGYCEKCTTNLQECELHEFDDNVKMYAKRKTPV